jgi:O-antigen/teichoic acid export membrane protein
MWYPIHAINLNLLMATGRSDYFLKLEVIKKIQSVIVLCATVPLGLVAMCYGRIVNSIICLIWNTYYTKKIIGYGYAQQMKDLMHILLHSLVMGAIVFGVVCMLPNLWLKLIMGILAGMAYYIAGAYLMKFEEMQELLLILKRK